MNLAIVGATGNIGSRVLDEALRPHQVWRHRLGVAQNTLVYHETDERFTLEVDRSRSRAFRKTSPTPSQNLRSRSLCTKASSKNWF